MFWKSNRELWGSLGILGGSGVMGGNWGMDLGVVPGGSGDIGRGLRGEMGILVWKSGSSGGKMEGLEDSGGRFWGKWRVPGILGWEMRS